MPTHFRRIEMAYQAAWSDLSQRAAGQGQVLLGAPGTIFERESAGKRYLVHQFLAADGKQRQVSIGRADDPDTQAAGLALTERIENTKGLIEQVRSLAKLGYQVANPKVYSVAAALYNAGLFHRGLTLVGSHAYGVLLNTFGIAAGFSQPSEIDVAFSTDIETVEPSIGLAELLAQTGLKFHSEDPFTSFKEVWCQSSVNGGCVGLRLIAHDCGQVLDKPGKLRGDAYDF